MNKKFKKFIFVFLIIAAVAALGVGGYFLFSNISSVTVTDFKIVDNQNRQIYDKNVYLLSDKDNKFNIDVKVNTTGGKASFYFVSSNSSVANVEYVNDSYYCVYYKPGSATITAYSSATSNVKDSFTINVYEEFVSDIVIDQKEDDVITVFADGLTHNYSYEAKGVVEDLDCNNMLIRVVENYDKSIITNISINPESKQISVSTVKALIDSKLTFNIQTYFIDSDNNEHIINNFMYFVDVIGYKIKDMQLLVSQDYHFTDNIFVYTAANSSKDDIFILPGEQIINDIFLTADVNSMFFKIRVVYSNNTYQDISYKLALSSGSENEYLNAVGGNSANTDYWTVSMDYDPNNPGSTPGSTSATDYLILSYTEKITESQSQSIESEFMFTYLVKTDESSSAYQHFINKNLYKKDTEKNIYVYTYWDIRFKRTDTITDKEGNIIGFIGAAPNCDNL